MPSIFHMASFSFATRRTHITRPITDRIRIEKIFELRSRWWEWFTWSLGDRSHGQGKVRRVGPWPGAAAGLQPL